MLPSHNGSPMPFENFFVDWFGKDIRGLFICRDTVNGDFFSIYILPEVVKFDIDMLRTRSVLVCLRHLQCT